MQETLRILDLVYVHSLRLPHLIAWHTRLHAHGPEEWELHYFLGGSGSFTDGRNRYPLERGRLHLTPPGRKHRIAIDSDDDPITYYALLFSVEDEGMRRSLEACIGVGKRTIDTFPRNIGPGRRVLFEGLKLRHVHDSAHRRAAAQHELAAFLHELFFEIEEDVVSPKLEHGWNIHVDRAVSLLQEQIHRSTTLAELATSVGVTREHLSRLFRAQFGIAPMAYFRRLKMEAAVSLLLNSTLSIKEVAWELGYDDATRFSSAFRRHVGTTPSRYRADYYRSNPTNYSRRVIG